MASKLKTTNMSNDRTPAQQISLLPCNLDEPAHQRSFLEILRSYMNDPMGDYPLHGESTERSIIDALQSHPSVFILFAAVDTRIAGMAVCFMNYATFQAAPFVNIHDLAVLPAFRAKGVATALLNGVAQHGIKQGCAKITLEVREDNEVARRLYAKMKFQSCAPPMAYLTRYL